MKCFVFISKMFCIEIFILDTEVDRQIVLIFEIPFEESPLKYL